MSSTDRKYFKSSYKFVIGKRHGINQPIQWYFVKKGVGELKCNSEREAAIKADMHLLGIGKEPVNLLKRV